MLFAVRFEDHQDRKETRAKYLQDHISWLEANSERVLVGGSLRVSPEENPIGGLWIVDAESKNAVETIIATDPFWVQELRSSVEILHWSKAFEDRQVSI